MKNHTLLVSKPEGMWDGIGKDEGGIGMPSCTFKDE